MQFRQFVSVALNKILLDKNSSHDRNKYPDLTYHSCISEYIASNLLGCIIAKVRINKVQISIKTLENWNKL